jgi:hypothetical protein
MANKEDIFRSGGLTCEDILAAFRQDAVDDEDWARVVGAATPHAVLTRWADALSTDDASTQVVRCSARTPLSYSGAILWHVWPLTGLLCSGLLDAQIT